MDVEPELVVVKVGGSLYDLPDLGQRLAAWVHRLPASKVLLVPGGGATTDVVRDLDRCHGLGEATAHDLAMRSLTLNAWFLAAVLRETAIGSLSVCNPLLSPLTDRVSVLDAHAFWIDDSRNHPDVLPACWDATSDSVAARAAVVLGASELVLLKSVTIAKPYDWTEAARLGVVDPVCWRLLSGALPRVRIVNLRAWC
ncbi:MAG TPA: hypothetical protein VKD72_18545 [Gemmataceae bacterium]|nr:hypothetical protein [Gemmataceae bacterium]